MPSLHSIDGNTRLMGLIGRGISYTLSPLMHNFAAEKLGLNLTYLPIELPNDVGLQAFLDTAWMIGALGFNVTTPYKAAIAALVGRDDLNSVNVLRRGATWWEGSSTDGLGFVRGLRQMNREISDFESCIVIGNGGAASAIVPYLKNQRIYMLRRNPLKDAEFGAADIHFLPFQCDALSYAIKQSSRNCLLIQATNSKLSGVNLEQFLPAMDSFAGAVSDLVYNGQSVLCDFAKDKGLPVQDGLAMLIEQARLSQEFWWGASVSYHELFDLIQTTQQERKLVPCT